MSNSMPLPLEQLESMLAELHAIKQRLDNDHIPNHLQAAEFQEVDAMLLQVQEDIEEAKRVLEAQNNQRPLSEIQADIHQAQQATDALNIQVEEALQDRATFLAQRDSYLEKVAAIRALLSPYEGFLVPTSSDRYGDPSTWLLLVEDYKRAVNNFETLENNLLSIADDNDSSNNNNTADQDPLQIKERIAALQRDLVTYEQAIQQHIMALEDGRTIEDLRTEWQQIKQTIEQAIGQVAEVAKTFYQQQLLLLETMRHQLELQEDGEVQEEMARISRAVEELEQEMQGHEAGNTLLDNQEQLLAAIAEQKQALQNTLDNIGNSGHLYEVAQTELRRLENMREQLQIAQQVAQEEKNAATQVAETTLAELSSAIQALEKEVYAYKADYSLFEHKETLLAKATALTQQLEGVDTALFQDYPPIMESYQQLNNQLPPLVEELENAKRVLSEAVLEKHQQLTAALTELQNSLQAAQAQEWKAIEETDLATLDQLLEEAGPQLEQFSDVVGQEAEAAFDKANELYNNSKALYDQLSKDLESFKSHWQTQQSIQDNKEEAMAALLAEYNNDPRALAEALAERLAKAEADYTTFLDTVTAANQ